MKTVLVGNGLSIPYNSDLSCPALLDELLRQFGEFSTTDDVEMCLRRLADSLDATAGSGLEELLGPLDVLAGAVHRLQPLASIPDTVATVDIQTAISRVQQFAVDVYRRGVSHVLETIAARAHGEDNYSVINRFGTEVTGAASQLCIATLNYDGLLHSSALDIPGVADIAAGYDERSEIVVPGGGQLIGYGLRHADDFLQDVRVELLNLHGSLGWLEHDGNFVKFKIDDLRDQGYWARWRAGGSGWTPAVVLTNQTAKNRRVLEYPFQLAYSIFETRLSRSAGWLVVGYGLGDQAVNETVQRAAKTRHRNGQGVRCLVVTRGGTPTQNHVAHEFGLDPSEVAVCVHGIPDAFSCSDWADWKSA